MMTEALVRPRNLDAFAQGIDRIRARVESELGPSDTAHIERVNRFSRAMEVVGRVLIHFSFEPVGFFFGVTALWLHKQLQATEIGHTALHGAFDKLPGAERFHSRSFRWEVPIDEEAWHQGHNVRHHHHTNIVGKDPDVRYGPVRLNARVPFKNHHRRQVWHALLTWPTFGFSMNAHFTGLIDLYVRKPGDFDFIKDKSWATIKRTHKQALRKLAPYYLKEYVVFPALAGPMFWKVMLGNFMAETMRDVYTAATIYCGHVGDDVADYPEGTRARSRAEFYAMQVESTNNFEVPLPVSMLCGALDRQIEHHLFPKFPTNRLREVAPEVRELCERHGIRYNTDTWPRTLRKVFRRIRSLSSPDPVPQLS